MKYQALTQDEKKTLTVKQIQKMLECVVRIETGADVEVTITPVSVLVYTEDLSKLNEIKAIVGQARELKSETHYEADEDGPAATTLAYSL